MKSEKAPWIVAERPTAWSLIAMLMAAVDELWAGRRPDLLIADLRRALDEFEA